MSNQSGFGIKRIREILPHRHPFLLVDRVLNIDIENSNIVALKSVSMNEEFFQGHFPQAPIMPGVLLLEALAQAGGILIYEKGFQDKTAVLLSVSQAKFRRPVFPGDTLLLYVHGKHFSSKGGKVQARGEVDGKVVVEAEITFALTSFQDIE